MPRRFYRSRIRYIKPKKKWSTNIVSDDLSFTASINSNNQPYWMSHALVTNSGASSSPTPVVIKAGNFKAQGLIAGDTENAGARILDMGCYIMFVPEGISPTNASAAFQLIGLHPEWIMGWTMVNIAHVASLGTDDWASKFSLSSRLKRNLNSGDQVQLWIVGHYDNGQSATPTFKVKFTSQFWTTSV